MRNPEVELTPGRDYRKCRIEILKICEVKLGGELLYQADLASDTIFYFKQLAALQPFYYL